MSGEGTNIYNPRHHKTWRGREEDPFINASSPPLPLRTSFQRVRSPLRDLLRETSAQCPDPEDLNRKSNLHKSCSMEGVGERSIHLVQSRRYFLCVLWPPTNHISPWKAHFRYCAPPFPAIKVSLMIRIPSPF